MKLVTFEHNKSARAGVWLGDEVADLSTANPRVPPGVLEILQAGGDMLTAVERAIGSAARIPASEVRLLAPLMRPGKIICIGQNYRDHCREQNVEPPAFPILFAKYDNAIIAPGDPIRLPSISNQVDYEAELAFVVGRRASRVSESEALNYIAGYTCLNDVSARDIQFGDKQWTRGKSLDTFCPTGPFLVTRDEIPDPQALAIRCTVSGETLQDSNTSNMIFGCAYLLSYISQGITLEPGDLVSTGTPHGVGVFRTPQRFLHAGDTVTISIDGVGELTNPVVS